MAKEKKLVESITSMEEDFAQWYTDVVKKAELIAYTSVKGCMAIKPAGYAIWENIQHELDRRFKETGVENVYMQMIFTPTVICRRYTTSGAPLSAGKRQPVRSCAPESSCGRRVILHTLPQKKQKRERSRC